jgi:glycosyltransferase involved in cell wall biosynthesis
LRIWLVNQYAIPPRLGGGTRHFSLGRELVRRGHKVAIVASSFHHLRREETGQIAGRQPFAVETIEGVDFCWTRTPGYRGNAFGRLRDMWSFARRLQSLPRTGILPPPDVIVGSNPHLFAARGAQRIAARLGIPFFLEIRDLWPLSLMEIGSISPYHPLMLWMGQIEKTLYRKAARVICLMPHAASYLSQRAGFPIEPVWIPNGVDFSLIPEEEGPRTGGRFTVMYAGSHGRVNSLDDILDACRILQDQGFGERIRCRLIGDGTEKKRLVERVTNEGLTNVEFDDPVEKAELQSVLRTADCFVVSSLDLKLYRYGISFNKLFDYFAAARPVVIALRSSNNPVEEAEAGLTTRPGDASGLADAIRTMYEMAPAERERMGRSGRAYVERYHGFERLGGLLEQTLEEGTRPVAAPVTDVSEEVGP